MKKIIFLIFLGIILIFSGCSGNNGSFLGSNNDKTGAVEEDITGDGLSISFSVDDNEILSKKIIYEFSISNSGKDIVEVSRKNINLITIQKMNDGTAIFTEDSLNNFYNKIFSDGDLNLVQNQEKSGIGGILEIKPEYFNNINNEKVDYVLSMNYDYKTHFSNNVKLDLKANSGNKFQILDKLSQAAPVKITNIELENGPSNDEYVLVFNIEDKNSFLSDEKSIVKFNNIELNFRSQNLNNCKYYIKENGFNKEISFENFVLNNKNKELVLKCLVNLQENKDESINTMISGQLTYNYKFEIERTTNFPNNRIAENSNWN